MEYFFRGASLMKNFLKKIKKALKFIFFTKKNKILTNSQSKKKLLNLTKHLPKQDYPEEDRKPIIYIYPKTKQPVSIQFQDPSILAHTYPKYKNQNSWEVIASPNGNLYHEKTKRNYYALYWEGKGGNYQKYLSTGFLVASQDTIYFLEEKLAILGLNEREINEFIIYWLPKMEKNKYNLVHFMTEEWDKKAPLIINPKPDTLIRIFMLYKPLNKKQDIPPQKLEKRTRKGYSVIEWGGHIIDYEIE